MTSITASLPRTEERKHVDRAIDRPIDILIEDGFNILELALVDRALQCTRETPETMLCHTNLRLELACKNGNGTKMDVIINGVRLDCRPFFLSR